MQSGSIEQAVQDLAGCTAEDAPVIVVPPLSWQKKMRRLANHPQESARKVHGGAGDQRSERASLSQESARNGGTVSKVHGSNGKQRESLPQECAHDAGTTGTPEVPGANTVKKVTTERVASGARGFAPPTQTVAKVHRSEAAQAVAKGQSKDGARADTADVCSDTVEDILAWCPSLVERLQLDAEEALHDCLDYVEDYLGVVLEESEVELVFDCFALELNGAGLS